MPSLKVVLRFQQQLSRSSETEGYHISVIKSPGRGWGGPFLPEGLDDAHINAVRQVYRAYVERQQTGPRLPLDERSWEILRAAGSQLFRVLPETVQARLHQAQSIAQEQGKSLEIVLAFDQTARPLLSLPWELLHNPAGRYFFALRGGGITRQVWLPTAPSVSKSFRPQAILGVWAEPEGVAGLSTRSEYSPAPGHEDGITWLAGADTLEQMEPALNSGKYDGLHIVAHGRADENWSDFSLALVGADGRPRWISPDQLAVFLSDYPQIRFVYLDVCASTVSGNTEGRADYLPGGLASSLLGMGVAAVVAMQDNISQEAAGLTAQVFYRELSQGADLAQAMTRTRRAVRLQLDDPIHWSVPALYSQQKPEDERSFGSLRAADWLLDNVRLLFHPGRWLVLAAILFAGYLARNLAQVTLSQVDEWRSLGLPVVQSIFLVIVGAFSMRAGQSRLGETYRLDRSGWLAVFLHKYTSAAIWAGMWWFLIGLGWLSLAWVGMADRLGVGGRQVVWTLSLLGLIPAGYVGARQAIRQSELFLRSGRTQATVGDWLLFLAVPLSPLFLLWLMVSFWRF